MNSVHHSIALLNALTICLHELLGAICLAYVHAGLTTDVSDGKLHRFCIALGACNVQQSLETLFSALQRGCKYFMH